jgi:hypothetical protein
MACYLEIVRFRRDGGLITRVREPWGSNDLAKATGHGQPGIYEVLELKRHATPGFRADLAYAVGLEPEEFDRRLFAGQYRDIAMLKSDRTMWRLDPDGLYRCRMCGKTEPKWVNHILTHERNHNNQTKWQRGTI